MGGAISSGVAQVEHTIDEKMMKRAMLQREIQLSIGIAQARDNLNWFASLYTALLTGLIVAKVANMPIPKAAAIPVFMGAFGLAFQADFAYGNKLARVTREAEFIMDNEQERFIPPQQAPFSKFYAEQKKTSSFYNGADASGIPVRDKLTALSSWWK